MFLIFFFFKQKTAYEMRISDWSSDVCSSDRLAIGHQRQWGPFEQLITRALRVHRNPQPPPAPAQRECIAVPLRRQIGGEMQLLAVHPHAGETENQNRTSVGQGKSG